MAYVYTYVQKRYPLPPLSIYMIPARGPQTKFSYIFCWYLLKPHVFCCSLGGRACQQVLRAKHLLTMSV